MRNLIKAVAVLQKSINLIQFTSKKSEDETK